MKTLKNPSKKRLCEVNALITYVYRPLFNRTTHPEDDFSLQFWVVFSERFRYIHYINYSNTPNKTILSRLKTPPHLQILTYMIPTDRGVHGCLLAAVTLCTLKSWA